MIRALALSCSLAVLAGCPGKGSAPSRAHTTFVAAPAQVPADGLHFSQLTLTVGNADGLPLRNVPVKLSASTTGVTLSPTSGITDNVGIFSAVASSSVGGAVTLTADVSSFALDVVVSFVASACPGVIQFTSPTVDGGILDAGFSEDAAALSNPPGWMQLGDFNGDGAEDVAVEIPGSSSIVLVLGQNDGSLFAEESEPIPLDSNPVGLAVADFNEDGQPDVAVAVDSAVVVLSVADGGMVQTPVTTDAPAVNGALVTADFNGDGKADVAAVAGQDIAILLGQGDGTFLAESLAPVGAMLADLITLDANGDGVPDLAASSPGTDTVFVLLGNGDGHFGNARPASVGAGPTAMIAGDFNSDRAVDIAVADVGDSGVLILLGDGAGSFRRGATVPVAPVTGPQTLAAIDFNSDGNLDLAVDDNVSGGVAILFGVGDGTFQVPFNEPYGENVVGLVAGSLGDPQTTGLVIGSGTFVGTMLGRCVPVPQRLSMDVSPVAVVADGVSKAVVTVTVSDSQGAPLTGQTVTLSEPGVVTVDPASGSTGATGIFTATVSSSVPGVESIRASVGTASMQAYVTFLGSCPTLSQFEPSEIGGAGIPQAVLVGDFNGDGRLDIASGGPNGLTLTYGDGAIGFERAQSVSSFPVLSLASADFNGDGEPDIAVAGDGLIALSSNERAGVLGTPILFLVPGIETPSVLLAADFNHDSRPDLAVLGTGSPGVAVLLNAGDGTFGEPVTFMADQDPTAVAAADFNGDGNPDLVVANEAAGDVSVLLGKGDGTFAAAVNIAVAANPFAVLAADLDGDHIPDITTAHPTLGSIAFLHGNGDGTFATPQLNAVSTAPRALAAEQFLADEPVDLVVADGQTGNLQLLVRDPDGGFAPVAANAISSPATAVGIGDFNDDGIPDLVAAGLSTPLTVELSSCSAQ